VETIDGLVKRTVPLVSTQARHIELPASVCGVGVGDGDGFQHVDDLGSQQAFDSRADRLSGKGGNVYGGGVRCVRVVCVRGTYMREVGTCCTTCGGLVCLVAEAVISCGR
jgi:hypothetical protein